MANQQLQYAPRLDVQCHSLSLAPSSALREVSSYTFSWTTAGADITVQGVFEKIGSFVHFTPLSNLLGVSSRGYLETTIPEAFRPSATFSMSAVGLQDSASVQQIGMCVVNVDPSGLLQICRGVTEGEAASNNNAAFGVSAGAILQGIYAQTLSWYQA